MTEMFLNDEESEYVLCFRPLGGRENIGKLSPCCYLQIAVREAMHLAHAKLLTEAIADELRERLSELSR